MSSVTMSSIYEDSLKNENCYSKHYFMNNLAYTENHILVHKLYVNVIPIQATRADIKNYFQNFGVIKNIQIMQGKENKCAIIDFLFAKEAARALREKDHLLCNESINVEAYNTLQHSLTMEIDEITNTLEYLDVF